MAEEEIGHTIIGAAIKVHSAVGPGLLESAYETCLLYELEKQKLTVKRQVLISIRYEDLTVVTATASIFSSVRASWSS